MRKTTLFPLLALLLTSLLLQACGSRKAAMILNEAEANFQVGNYVMAHDQLLPLAMKGDEDAQYAVAYLYYYGYGAPKDIDTARSWMRKAAAGGNIAAVDALIMMAEQDARLYSTHEESFISITPDIVTEELDALDIDGIDAVEFETAEIDIDALNIETITLDAVNTDDAASVSTETQALEIEIATSTPPLAPAVSTPASGEQYGPVSPQESLWAIASQIDSQGQASTGEVAQAIFEMNPRAFANNDMGNLLAGSMLTLPHYAAATGTATAVSPSTVSTTETASTSLSLGSTYGPVSETDTLWQIASQVERSGEYSMQDLLAAIFAKNPQAFADNDIGQLMAGSTLNMPTVGEIGDVAS